MIRIYVIEDHQAIIVAGLKRFFSPQRDGIDIVGSSMNAEDAIAGADPARFDIILLDLWLENRNPVNNLTNLLKKFPDKKIIIYTQDNSAKWKYRMYKEGAAAYITKDTPRNEIKSIVLKVSRGEKLFNIRLDESDKQSRTGKFSASLSDLSVVEKDILHHLFQGKSHKETARIMGVSSSTVDKTLSRLKEQFEVKNNYELYALLKDSGEI